MASTRGRSVVVPLTNKSGGGVIAGDVVIVGTANNDAFTTTTSASFTGTVGIAQETIADSATGRVLIAGYAALVNTTASVTRQNYGTTSTTVKKAVDAGSARAAGTFCQFLTGGTTPDAIVFPSDLGAGSGAPTTAPYVTTAADGGLSAEVVHPELAELGSGTPTTIDMSGAATGTGVSVSATGGLYDITFTNAALQHWDVTSAIGTGDFDLRMRVIDAHPQTNDAGLAPFFYLLATDSARGSSYSLVRIAIRSNGTGLAAGGFAWCAAYVAGAQVGNGSGSIQFPVILRIKRVGTTVTCYMSEDEGYSWTTLGSGTSALNIGKIGAYMVTSAGTTEAIVHWVRTYA